LAFAQYLHNFIVKITSSISQILAYLERAQENDYMKKVSVLGSFPSQDMIVQTWMIVLFSRLSGQLKKIIYRERSRTPSWIFHQWQFQVQIFINFIRYTFSLLGKP